MSKKRITDKEVDYIKEHWGNKTINEIAEGLGRAYISIYKKAQSLKLGPAKQQKKYNAWTEEEEEKVWLEYEEKGPRKLSEEMPKRTMQSIRQRYTILLKKKEEEKLKPARTRKREKEYIKVCECGNKNLNRVPTNYKTYTHSFYCMDCGKEYTPYGKEIPPLWEDGLK